MSKKVRTTATRNARAAKQARRTKDPVVLFLCDVFGLPVSRLSHDSAVKKGALGKPVPVRHFEPDEPRGGEYVDRAERLEQAHARSRRARVDWRLAFA